MVSWHGEHWPALPWRNWNLKMIITISSISTLAILRQMALLSFKPVVKCQKQKLCCVIFYYRTVTKFPKCLSWTASSFFFLRLVPYLIFKSSSTSLHICPPSRNLWTMTSYPAWHVNSDPCIEKIEKVSFAQQLLQHILESMLNSLREINAEVAPCKNGMGT